MATANLSAHIDLIVDAQEVLRDCGDVGHIQPAPSIACSRLRDPSTVDEPPAGQIHTVNAAQLHGDVTAIGSRRKITAGRRTDTPRASLLGCCTPAKTF